MSDCNLESSGSGGITVDIDLLKAVAPYYQFGRGLVPQDEIDQRFMQLKWDEARSDMKRASLFLDTREAVRKTQPTEDALRKLLLHALTNRSTNIQIVDDYQHTHTRSGVNVLRARSLLLRPKTELTLLTVEDVLRSAALLTSDTCSGRADDKYTVGSYSLGEALSNGTPVVRICLEEVLCDDE